LVDFGGSCPTRLTFFKIKYTRIVTNSSVTINCIIKAKPVFKMNIDLHLNFKMRDDEKKEIDKYDE